MAGKGRQLLSGSSVPKRLKDPVTVPWPYKTLWVHIFSKYNYFCLYLSKLYYKEVVVESNSKTRVKCTSGDILHLIWRTWQPKFEQRGMATHSGIKIILRRETSEEVLQYVQRYWVFPSQRCISDKNRALHCSSYGFIASVVDAKLSSK